MGKIKKIRIKRKKVQPTFKDLYLGDRTIVLADKINEIIEELNRRGRDK